MSVRWLFAGIAALSMLAGAGLWLAMRPAPAASADPVRVEITPGALMAVTFTDAAGQARSLAAFPGKLLVVNFWATWCGPCREEMPAFTRLQARWQDRGVQFVGLSDEDPAKVHPFGKSLAVNYPLWTGGEEIPELSRRLGNKFRGLPYTAIIAPGGQVMETRVGPYTESELEQRLLAYAANTQQLR